jgi:hypothetical protein
MLNSTYLKKSQMLLENINDVFQSPYFALKGGTAINFFVRNMPRLSVDIDVVFTDYILPRNTALQIISNELTKVQKCLERAGLTVEKNGDETKLFVFSEEKRFTIEVNHISRGTFLPVEVRSLMPAVIEQFGISAQVQLLAKEELYGGKLVAALSRQHPRDLFDVHEMFLNSGLTQEIMECFVGYLAGDNKAIHEVLFSRDLDIQSPFTNEFLGMLNIPISLDMLLETRAQLRREIAQKLTLEHKRFLIGLAEGKPSWNLMRFPHLSEMPAIKWKLQNLALLQKNDKARFAYQADILKKHFDNHLI